MVDYTKYGQVGTGYTDFNSVTIVNSHGMVYPVPQANLTCPIPMGDGWNGNNPSRIPGELLS